jgi:hypothetical protein
MVLKDKNHNGAHAPSPQLLFPMCTQIHMTQLNCHQASAIGCDLCQNLFQASLILLKQAQVVDHTDMLFILGTMTARGPVQNTLVDSLACNCIVLKFFHSFSQSYQTSLTKKTNLGLRSHKRYVVLNFLSLFLLYIPLQSIIICSVSFPIKLSYALDIRWALTPVRL